MATTELLTRIALCSKPLEDWEADETVILKGEICIASDVRHIRAGDGVHTWSGLTDMNMTPEEIIALINAASHTHGNLAILEATTASFTSELLEKLNGIATGANKTVVDSELSSSSTNPVQNKVVNSALEGKVPTTRKVNGKALSTDISLTYSDVGADKSGAASTAEQNAKAYTDSKTAEAKSYTDTEIAALIGAAPETRDTLEELATAIATHEDVTDALNAAIGNKVDKVSGKRLSTNDLTNELKAKYDVAYEHSQEAHAPSNAERNVIVGIQKNGTDLTVDTTTRKVNITVPTKLSEMTNDSGFITSSGTSKKTKQLETARKVDGVNFDGTTDISHYAECSTAAATVAKTVSVTGFNLVTGACVKVKFTVTNTAANPTLNVSSTGAKAIMYRGTAISASILSANRVYEFVYDGTDWELLGDLDSNTTYKADTGIKLNGTTFQHTNAVTPGTAKGDDSKTLTYGGTFTIQGVTFDAEGHITGQSTTIMTMPAIPSNVTSATKLQTARNFSITGAATAAAVSFNGEKNVALNVTALNAINLYVNNSDTLILNGNF